MLLSLLPSYVAPPQAPPTPIHTLPFPSIWVGPHYSHIRVSAQTFALISTIFYGLAINSGYGRHILTLSESALASAIKWNLIATVTFSVSLIFSKVSVCFLFLRILGRTRTTPKVAFLYGMAALSAVIGFIAAGYTAGQCSPPEKDWDHDIPGKCHGDVSMHIAYAQAGTSFFLPGQHWCFFQDC